MGTDSVGEILHIFHKRADVLHCICGGDLDKRTVENRIESSRPTIDRAYRELEEIGILSSAGTSYELTTFGEICCSEFCRIEDTLGTVAEMKDLLAKLPRDTGIGVELLRDADVHYAKPHAPQEPFAELVDVARGANEMAGYSSSIMPHYVDAFHALVVDEETPATLIFTEDVVETGRSNYTEQFGEILAADNATVYATADVYRYGAVVADGAVAVPVGNRQDRLQAVICNDTDDAAAWVHAFLDDIIAADHTRTV